MKKKIDYSSERHNLTFLLYLMKEMTRHVTQILGKDNMSAAKRFRLDSIKFCKLSKNFRLQSTRIARDFKETKKL